jgi:hypothetical protein
MTHTIQSVRAFVQSQRESDEPDEVLAVLKANDGKQLTKRILDKLPGGAPRWRLSRNAGMTHLETWDYVRSGGKTGMHFLMAYAEESVVIDAAWVEEHNPAYFKGRRERNASRDEVLQNNGLGQLTVQRMVNTLNAYEDAKAKLDAAKETMDNMSGFDADRYDWEKLAGAES